ncbi:MAG: CDP-glycerol glycerophosphotransferase family protein [Jeotgalicoccus sp.]
MIKEGAISVFLTVLRTVFNIFRWLPLKEKTIMLTSFGDNMEYVIDEVRNQTSSEIFILKEPRCRKSFNNIDSQNIIDFNPRKVLSLIRGMYHLATGKYIFIDNYHVVLAACNFRPAVKCTQLWHANGAVKYFGYRDRTITKRLDSAHERFKKVYSRFHYFTVSSDEMAYIFGEAFGADDSSMIKSGVPRTDFFYNNKTVNAAAEKIHQALPELTGKKVLLYAPTFRDDQFDVDKIHLDIELMKETLNSEFHLLLKLHPAVKLSGFINDEFVTDVSGRFSINSLLSAADVLITDYSSIPFEFSILNRPMIFFPYDLKEYEEKRGTWFNYESYMPGPIAYNTETIIYALQENNYDIEKIKSFNNQWNKYSNGQSSRNLVDYIYRT